MSSPNEYSLGTDVICSVVFRNAAGVIADPDTVKFSVKPPGGPATTYTYLVGQAIVKDSVGQYHVNVDANAAGEWFYRFFSLGNGKAADENSFTVSASEF